MKIWVRSVWEIWKEIAVYIGDFQSRLLLTVFYFTLAVPFGVIARFVVDRLNMRHQPATSAWAKRQAKETDLPAMQKQF